MAFHLNLLNLRRTSATAFAAEFFSRIAKHEIVIEILCVRHTPVSAKMAKHAMEILNYFTVLSELIVITITNRFHFTRA